MRVELKRLLVSVTGYLVVSVVLCLFVVDAIEHQREVCLAVVVMLLFVVVSIAAVVTALLLGHVRIC